MLAAKLYIRNKCAQTKIDCIITIINNKIIIEKGRNNNSISNDFRISNKRILNESIYQIFTSRDLKIVNNLTKEISIILNRILIEYVVD